MPATSSGDIDTEEASFKSLIWGSRWSLISCSVLPGAQNSLRPRDSIFTISFSKAALGPGTGGRQRDTFLNSEIILCYCHSHCSRFWVLCRIIVTLNSEFWPKISKSKLNSDFWNSEFWQMVRFLNFWNTKLKMDAACGVSGSCQDG